jgi:hypothetical protein
VEKCALICAPAEFHLTREKEKPEYDLHENDPGYRQFLGRLADPLLKKLTTNSPDLDFGCGPGPTLSLMFEEADHQVALHDPFYQPNRAQGLIQFHYRHRSPRAPPSSTTRLGGHLELPETRRLEDLGNYQLTDVKGLEKLTQLRALVLQNKFDLTKAQIDPLKKALPKCKIQHNAKK